MEDKEATHLYCTISCTLFQKHHTKLMAKMEKCIQMELKLISSHKINGEMEKCIKMELNNESREMWCINHIKQTLHLVKSND